METYRLTSQVIGTMSEQNGKRKGGDLDFIGVHLNRENELNSKSLSASKFINGIINKYFSCTFALFHNNKYLLFANILHFFQTNNQIYTSIWYLCKRKLVLQKKLQGIVHLFIIKLGQVDLGGLQILVTQGLGDDANVDAGFLQYCGKAVSGDICGALFFFLFIGEKSEI